MFFFIQFIALFYCCVLPWWCFVFVCDTDYAPSKY